ncbi:ABC transporter permease [Oceanicoccus sp. KOV_DT_Chl]|uniref:ABC transporter permease n=1 Tax=Oceanicoccus sp. KOV_DT_Chl TaxID=1904639 RepID=UPI000C7AAA2E|nr:ABC transporter permease [Oceanicoccus sp. KOV_DT_Chl]
MSAKLKKANKMAGYSVYRPDMRRDSTIISAVISLWLEANQYRWHIAYQFKKNLAANFNQTALGNLWAVLLPLLPVSVFILLTSGQILGGDRYARGPLYVTLGFTVWAYISDMILVPTSALKQKKVLIEKSQLPMVAVILPAYTQILFDTLVRSVLVAIVVILFVDDFLISALWVVPILFTMTFFAFGFGVLLALAGLVMPDLNNITTVVLRYAMFLSCVIFPLPDTPLFLAMQHYNPFAIFINNFRSLISIGEFHSQVPLIVVSVISVAVFLFAMRLLYVVEPRLKGNY